MPADPAKAAALGRPDRRPRLRHHRGRVRGLDRQRAAAAGRYREGRCRRFGEDRARGDRRSRRGAEQARRPARQHQFMDARDAGRRIARRFHTALRPPTNTFTAHAAIDAVRRALPREGLLSFDVGAHTHQIASQWTAHAPKTFHITNGWSSMGFGLPGAIAAKLARPDLPVVCMLGDGCFQMTCGEVAVAKRMGIALPVVVLDDKWLALIKVKQIRRQFPAVRHRAAVRGLHRAAVSTISACRRSASAPPPRWKRRDQGARRQRADRDRGGGRFRPLHRHGLRLNAIARGRRSPHHGATTKGPLMTTSSAISPLSSKTLRPRRNSSKKPSR